MSVCKRKRGTCFNDDETELLIKLVEKYKSVVENKETNGKTWQEKKDVWLRIENEFNACSSTFIYRSTVCLKGKYNSIKKAIRKKCAIKRRKTGGATFDGLDPIEERVQAFIGKSVKEVEGDLDVEDEVEAQQQPTLIKTETLEAEEYSSILESEHQQDEGVTAEFSELVNICNSAEIDLITTQPQFNRSSNSTGQIKDKKAKKLRNLETASASSMQQVIDAKLELARLMKQELIEEGKRKREEHLLKMEAMRLDIILKKKTIG